jgi:Salmonella virulence plasmid 65kDa B protein
LAQNSQSTGSVISLPQGGGALSGSGEIFSPDLHTGTGNFTVPIALPSGRNGFRPQLNLVYSTGNRNNPFGLGWGLSIPRASRKTSRGIPRYADEHDTFPLFRRGGPGARRENRGSASLSPAQESALRSHRARQVGGRRFLAGAQQRRAGQCVWNAAQHPERSGGDRQSGESSQGVQLAPQETDGPFGHTIQYKYERDTGNTSDHHWDQLYLRRIQYADYTELEYRWRPVEKLLVSVAFVYEERPSKLDNCPYEEMNSARFP